MRTALFVIVSSVSLYGLYPAAKINSEFETIVWEKYPQLLKDGWILVFSDPSYCPPCRAYEPILKQIEKTYRVQVLQPSKHHAISQYFNITRVPTTIILVDGKEISRRIGLQSPVTLLAMPGVEKCKKPEPPPPPPSWLDKYFQLFLSTKVEYDVALD